MDLLAHPFTLNRSGHARTVRQGSDADYRQQLAVGILTRRGERTLVPTFGLTEPVAYGIDRGELQAHVDRFGPPVSVVEIVAEPTSPTRADVTVVFDRLDPAADA